MPDVSAKTYWLGNRGATQNATAQAVIARMDQRYFGWCKK
jgi:hypothetical protein